MEKEKEIKEISKILSKKGLFTVKDVMNVNHTPHPYTIGPRHLERNDSMYLGIEQIERMEEKYGPMCAHPRCDLEYADHKSDKVLFLQLTKNLKNKQAGAELLKLKPFMEENGFAGAGFVDTPEKFRIENE